jgi:hypothetical protein
MAIIYSYPQATPTASDLIIGTSLSDESGENPTKSFSISDIIGLVPAAGTGGTVTSVGLTNTDGKLVITNSPITTSGNMAINLYTTGGTPSSTTFYRGDGQWATPPNTTPILYTITSVTNGPNTDIVLTPSSGASSIVKLIPGNDISIVTSSSEITIASNAVSEIGTSTFIGVDDTNPLIPVVSLSATGTPSTTTYLRGDNTWATIAAGGTMSSWDLAADSGTAEAVSEAETVTIAGGTGITTAVAATNTVTVSNSGVLSALAGTNVAVSGATGDVTVSAPNAVVNTTDTYASYASVTNIITLSAAEYAAIGTKDPNTLYIAI